MPTTIKKHEKKHAHPGRTAILKKLDKSTRVIAHSTILSILSKKGAAELTLAELRTRLSVLKTPLSQEIIAERKKG